MNLKLNKSTLPSFFIIVGVCLMLIACGDNREIRRYKEYKDLNKTRVIAVMVPFENATWFFKMSGPQKWVGKEKGNLDQLLNSMKLIKGADPEFTLPQGWSKEINQEQGFTNFQMGESSQHIDLTVKKFPFGSNPATQLASINIVRKTVSLPELKSLSDDIKRNIAGQTSVYIDVIGEIATLQTKPMKPHGNPGSNIGTVQAGGDLKYDAPSHWKDLGASGMRKAAFEASEGNEKTTITAIPLGVNAGAILSNINRWRDQIGLQGKITEEELIKLQEHFHILGAEAVFVDLAHEEPKTDSQRTIAAIFRTQENTWFFKMTGNHNITGKEKNSFKKFLHSIRF